MLKKGLFYLLYALGRIIDACLGTLAFATFAIINQLSFALLVVAIGVGLDVLRAVSSLRDPADRMVAASPLMQKLLHPNARLYVAFSAVAVMSLAYIAYPDICLPGVTNFIEKNIGIVGWHFEELGAVCDVEHGTIIVISHAVYTVVFVLGMSLIILSAEFCGYRYWQLSSDRAKRYYVEHLHNSARGKGVVGPFVVFLILCLMQLLPFSPEYVSRRSYMPQTIVMLFLVYSLFSLLPLAIFYHCVYARLRLNQNYGVIQ